MAPDPDGSGDRRAVLKESISNHHPDTHAVHRQEHHQAPIHSVAGTARPLADVTHRAHEGHAGHDKHAGHSVEMFRQKFWGTLLLSILTLVWAPMIQQWFGYQAPGGPAASRWIPAVFGSLVFGYGGPTDDRRAH